MASLDQILNAMTAQGVPHPQNGKIVADGKEHRYGKGRKAWYKINERLLKSGGSAYYGSFGLWSGTDNGAVGVSLEEGEVSAEDLADIRKRTDEAAAASEAKRKQEALKAAGRANNQWNDSATDGRSDYIDRKQITPEGVRFSSDGLVLVPAKRYAIGATKLIGVQKISPDGSKTFNKGMEKAGAACLIGPLSQETPLLMVGEGYATCMSARMATASQYPVVVGFDAGNLMPVVIGLRRDFPNVPFLFLADDDWLLRKRLAKRLVKEFKIAATLKIDGEAWPLYQSDFETDGEEADDDLIARLEKGAGLSQDLSIDGKEHLLQSENAEVVTVTAFWRTDDNGIDYIEADVRCGRVMRMIKFENAGRSKASAAAKAVGKSLVVYPSFVDRGQRKITDYNDLHVTESLDSVTEQLLPAIDQLLQSASWSAAIAEIGDSAQPEAPSHIVESLPLPTIAEIKESDKSETPLTLVGGTDVDGYGEAPAAAPGAGEGEEKPPAAKKPKKVYPPEFWDRVNYLLENYVLIYGTDDAWDADNRMILKVAHMRLAHGNDVIKMWLGNGERKMVNKDRVVFDPTEKCDPESSVNLYHGFEMQPRPGICNQIMLLLDHLCGGHEDTFEWVLKWLAFPLQNKGAKMRTSIIIHGDEGSGKNLFFENVIKRIYGEYGGVIGNAQIESQFNEWASKKLYFVADEVVTRNELRQLKGKLKHMITGESIMINPKNMTERSEANHMNFVFLSNELQPLVLDKTDRRYLVIWTPQNKPAEFYKDVADEIEAGGVEAFYDFLMHLDLEGFNEHTKPLITEAKIKLIGLGLSPPEKFYREWSLGFLPLPYMTCSAQQLYAGFLRWCHLNGEKFMPSQTYFGRQIERIGIDKLIRKVIKFDLGSEHKQRTVYLIGEKPECHASLKDWSEAASSLFEKGLRQYRHVHDQPMDLTTDVHGISEVS